MKLTNDPNSCKATYRILVGTVEIAGQIPIFADGFRQLGHQVTTVSSWHQRFYPDIEYDVELTRPIISWPERIAQSKSLLIRIPRGAATRLINRRSRLLRALQLIVSHDVFFFLAGSLLPEWRDYPLIKGLGKKIVSFFVGSDARHWSAYDQQHIRSRIPHVSLKETSESYKSDPLIRPLRNLRMGERFSDLILLSRNAGGLAVRPHMRSFLPLNLFDFDCNIPAREVPVVIHAPSHKGLKGTDAILAALEHLRSEGVPFELRLLHEVPNYKVREELADADIAIDQLHLPTYGKFGVEAMASGCALATCNREDIEPIPSNRPIWHIEPTNLYDQLKRLLTDRDLRVRLAQEGRQYVEEYHDHVKVVQRIIDCLDANNIARYDFYPDFFARHYHLPDGETIPDDLKRMTTEVIQRWGLPEGVDPQDMIARGLMAADNLDATNPIARWEFASPT